ncbi:hypothetical protein ACOSP7_008185 [Xanthoceras sorbifolium]
MSTADQLHETVMGCLSEVKSDSHEVQQKALQTLVSITKVSPQNRSLLAQTDGAISTLLDLCKSSSSSSSNVIQALSLSILFNLSLNPDLKRSLAEMGTIYLLNSMIQSPTSPESCKLLASSMICSLAMLDKNKAKFGAAGTIPLLVESVSKKPSGRPPPPAAAHHHHHHLLSSLAELVQFHGNCTLAVRSGAVPVLLQLVVGSSDDGGEDLAGTSLAILNLLARFDEGLIALRSTDQIVSSMVDVLKGRSMFSKEGAAEILLRLFDESEGCMRDASRLPEFSTVLADLQLRGSARAREKASQLMKKMMETNFDSYLSLETPCLTDGSIDNFIM